MNKIIAVLFILSVIGSFIYRKYVVNRVMNRLSIALSDNKGEDSYMAILDSREVKLYFSNFSKEYLRMNYYVLQDNTAKVRDCYEKILRIRRINKSDQIALYRQLLSYYAEKGLREDAEAIYKRLKKVLESGKDVGNRVLLHEAIQIMDVYIYKNTSKIPSLLVLIETTSNVEKKSVYQFRLAKLYYYNNEVDKCKEMLLDARSNTQNTSSIATINHILSSNLEKL